MFQESSHLRLAHDIGFATFRVAKLVRHRKLKTELENAAIDLVKYADLESIEVLYRIVRLAEVVGEMNSVNADVLRRELENLRNLNGTEIAELPDVEAIKLDDIFSNGIELKSEAADPKSETVKLGNRQSEVFQFIRQFPDNCRMKDLLVRFPYVSERTLRNDIQKLISRSLIERVGSKSGPLSYLKAMGEIEKLQTAETPSTIFLSDSNPE